MDRNTFEELLFQSAACVMACDGEIHQRELEKIRELHHETSYFQNLDVENEIQGVVADLKKNGQQVIDQYLSTLYHANLDIMQELLVLEVILKVIYSDNRLDDNEIQFLKIVRSRMKVPNELISERFGKIEILAAPSSLAERDSSLDEWKSQIHVPEVRQDIEIKPP